MKSNNGLLTITVFGITTRDIDDLIDTIKNGLEDAQTDFFYFKYAKIAGIGPLLPAKERSDKVMSRNIDFNLPYNFEVVS